MKIVQIIYRIRYAIRFYRKEKFYKLLDTRSAKAKLLLLRPALKSGMVGDSEFRFLNESHHIELPGDWNNHKRSDLWQYNLHYHDALVSMGNERNIQRHYRLIKRWIIDNCSGRGLGWDPYPTSRRICNWIIFSQISGGLDVVSRISLAMQADMIMRRMEYHILGNHLIANAKALIFSGLYFIGREAGIWLKKGCMILSKELSEQVHPDGGHYELSPMYHSIVLMDLLDIIAYFKSMDMKYPENWNIVASRMIRWQAVMTHPDGEISLFNDSAFGIVPDPKSISSYAQHIGLLIEDDVQEGITTLQDSGYIRLENVDAVLIADVAEIGSECQPGHGHADALSFELSLGGRRIIVDSGISLYGRSAERLRQRGTDAHNTVSVDGNNSSEVWSGFRVARRAKIIRRDTNCENNTLVTTGIHDGFRRFPGVQLHTRTWKLYDRELLIIDKITGSGNHDIKCGLNFHPEHTIDIYENIARVRNITNISIVLCDRIKWRVVPTTWHPEFGLSVPSHRLSGEAKLQLPTEWETRITW